MKIYKNREEAMADFFDKFCNDQCCPYKAGLAYRNPEIPCEGDWCDDAFEAYQLSEFRNIII